MYLNQPLSEILTLDISEASEIIRQYNKLTSSKSKPSKPKGLPKIDYSQQKSQMIDFIRLFYLVWSCT